MPYARAVAKGAQLAPLVSGRQIKHIETASEVARDKSGANKQLGAEDWKRDARQAARIPPFC